MADSAEGGNTTGRECVHVVGGKGIGIMKAQNTRLILILAAALSLLLIPFVAMKFTGEVNWTALDFVTMGIMLLCTGIGIEVALRMVKITWARVAAVVGVLFAFVMVWGALVHMGG